jgi:hypothetical protein
MCAAAAALLNSGMFTKAVCVDSIVCPFVNLTVNGLLVIVLFKLGAFDNKKSACVYKGCLIVLKQGWGTTIIKCFAIIFRCRPQDSILVDLGPSHVVCFGYMQVWLVWERATL